MAMGFKSLHGSAFGLSLPDLSPVVDSKRMERMGRLNYLNVAPSTAITATTTETLFSTFATVKANLLWPGSFLKIRFQGIVTAKNAADTLAIKLYFGGIAGVNLISMPATNVSVSDVFQGEYELAIRTIGATGTMVGVGTFKSIPAAEGTMTIKDDILPSTTFNSMVANVIGVSAQWSTNNAGNSCRLDIMRVEQY